MEHFYRFVVGSMGIYEAVDKDCPKHPYDTRRDAKPDGSWVPKKGPNFPGAISFWTKKGLKKYIESGLCAWHVSVVKGGVHVEKITRPGSVLYEDEYQIIVDPKHVVRQKGLRYDEFLVNKPV